MGNGKPVPNINRRTKFERVTLDYRTRVIPPKVSDTQMGAAAPAYTPSLSRKVPNFSPMPAKALLLWAK